MVISTSTSSLNILLLIGLSFYLGSQLTIWLSIFDERPPPAPVVHSLVGHGHEHSHHSESVAVTIPTPTADMVKKESNRNNNSATRKLRRKADNFLHDVAKVGEHETILGTLIGSLIRESHSGLVYLIPSEGYFLDAGMQFGEFGAHMAVNAPDREVMMLDPSPKNVVNAKVRYEGDLPNLHIFQGGLGDEVKTMKARDESFQMEVGAEFPLYTIDSLFYEKGRKLAFAHLDVEGLELDVLKGAVQTMRQSKPIFTTEVRVHKDVAYTDALMDFIFDLGYDSYVINEVCGYPHMDYRNILNIPRFKSQELIRSDTFNLLYTTKSITRLPVRKEETKTIFDLVMPCCALGEGCCPGDDINDESCCSEELVKKWLEENKPDGNPNYYTWKEAKQNFDRSHYRLNQRMKVRHGWTAKNQTQTST